MTAADRLETLHIDMAVWEEKSEGYHRVVFSPTFWPALVALVRAVEDCQTNAILDTDGRAVRVAKESYVSLLRGLSNLGETLR
jgi:ABC-type Zn2+ transport system substrate-binding protein/surface adhesin